MLKILIIVTSHALLGTTGKPTGYYLSEVSHPYHEFKQAGYEIDFASIKGGDAPVDPKSLDMKDAKNKEVWEDAKVRGKLKNTLKLSEVNPKNYKAVLFAGGHGTMWDFRTDKDVQRVIKKVYEAQGVVGAVCHGPSALVDVKLSNGQYLVAGKKVAAFTNEEEEAVKLTQVMPFLLETDLKKKGAVFVGKDKWQENVQVSERLVTGQNPASASLLGKEMIKLLRK